MGELLVRNASRDDVDCSKKLIDACNANNGFADWRVFSMTMTHGIPRTLRQKRRC